MSCCSKMMVVSKCSATPPPPQFPVLQAGLIFFYNNNSNSNIYNGIRKACFSYQTSSSSVSHYWAQQPRILARRSTSSCTACAAAAAPSTTTRWRRRSRSSAAAAAATLQLGPAIQTGGGGVGEEEEEEEQIKESESEEMRRYRKMFCARMDLAGLKPHHRIAMGVSGGADSMALCILASAWKKKKKKNPPTYFPPTSTTPYYIPGLLAIVVDHGLRDASKSEATLVNQWLHKIGIQCETSQCIWPDGKPKPGHLEEEARNKRYDIFQKICLQHHIDALLIGHHSDDQAELFILRLSRNSGVLGLAGMAFVSQLFPIPSQYCSESPESHGILLVRPLLEFSKCDLYKICQLCHQTWVEDPSNQSMLFVRNRIRQSLKKISDSFLVELQATISACRKTRSFVDQMCMQLIKDTVTVMDYGYAVIDLKKLDACKVNDLCLSKFIASILQFISQRTKPVRGGILQKLLHYFRDIPCKGSFTAAGCYISAFPKSKGMKIVISCSCDSPQPADLNAYNLNTISQHISSVNTEMIIEALKSYNSCFLPTVSDVHFLQCNSTKCILDEARQLNLLGEETLASVMLLQRVELSRFHDGGGYSANISHGKLFMQPSAHVQLQSGQTYHFMNRFVVKWEHTEEVSEDETLSSVTGSRWKLKNDTWDICCDSCPVRKSSFAVIRTMKEADWLCLSDLAREQSSNGCDAHKHEGFYCSDYVTLSAERALDKLKSIPVAARRSLPVLTDSEDLLLSVPNICFKRCPHISVSSVFSTRVPLGGGFTSYA